MSIPHSQFGANMEGATIPKKQQWSLINQHKAMEFQRMKQIQRITDLEKKMKLKKELDNQIYNRKDLYQQQKDADRKYYEFISKRSEEMKQKQQKQRVQKFLKRRQIQEENQFYLEKMRNSRHRETDPGINMQIGVKGEFQRKRKAQIGKRQMMDTLDKQIQIKSQEKKYQKMHNLHVDALNNQYQYDQHDKRNRSGKHYGQNQRVYDYYDQINHDKSMKERQLEHIIVEEAALRKKQEDEKKEFVQNQHKYQMKNQMKQTLEKQINVYNNKVENEKKTNPEENTYAFIGKMFKERPSPYDKRQYSDYLRRQAEEHNTKQIKQKYMNEEQYRLNMNQLNRAVSGDYVYNKYIDRSVGAIGENKGVNLSEMKEPVKDQDKGVVQMKLENIRHKTKPYEYRDRSF